MAKNFMKNHWIWDEGSVQPTIMEELNAFTAQRELKKPIHSVKTRRLKKNADTLLIRRLGK